MNESTIMKNIQLFASRIGVMLFRNNTGAYKTDAGYYVKYGVGEKGGSDLIGVSSITITPEMVGRTFGVFTAIEVKTKTGRATKEQIKFIEAIKKQGGIAGIARDNLDAARLIEDFKHGRN